LVANLNLYKTNASLHFGALFTLMSIEIFGTQLFSRLPPATAKQRGFSCGGISLLLCQFLRMVHGPLRKRRLFVTKISGVKSSVDLKIVIINDSNRFD